MAAERRIVASGVVEAPPDEVWELISDTSRYHEWVVNTLAVLEHDGRARVGGRYVERNTVLGPLKGTARWEVTELDDERRRQVHRGEGLPLVRDMAIEMEVQPAGEHSELILTLRYTTAFGPLGAALDRAAAGSVKHNQERSVENLAALAKSEGRGRTLA